VRGRGICVLRMLSKTDRMGRRRGGGADRLTIGSTTSRDPQSRVVVIDTRLPYTNIHSLHTTGTSMHITG